MIDLQNKIVLFDVESTPLFSTTHSFLNIEAIILSQTMRWAVGTGGLLVISVPDKLISKDDLIIR